MLSNGWDNDTAALQLFSHLEGDALNVAHLVLLSRPLSRSGLVDALTAHYGSPGRLADYRRQWGWGWGGGSVVMFSLGTQEGKQYRLFPHDG